MRVITKNIDVTLLRETKSVIEDEGLKSIIEKELGNNIPITSLRSYNNAVVDGVNNAYLVFVDGQFYVIGHFKIYNEIYIVGVGWKLNQEEEEKFGNNSLDVPSELEDTELQYIVIGD